MIVPKGMRDERSFWIRGMQKSYGACYLGTGPDIKAVEQTFQIGYHEINTGCFFKPKITIEIYGHFQE
ncbi:MAG TPA: hypothetical protein ENH85_04245 [Candidatus Scalindua sp.]|nr:hypothetical protein [Candidatus Scalindua sp.]